MADPPGVPLQQQRAFAKNLKVHSALQIRQSTSASVRAAEKVSGDLLVLFCR